MYFCVDIMGGAISVAEYAQHSVIDSLPASINVKSTLEKAPFFSSITYEASILDHVELPDTEQPVFVLGQCYSALYDREDIKQDVLSRLWFTYRQGFPAIGGTGPSSDKGWGCMLRCGQMMMAQALVCRHLGRDWRWNSKCYNHTYERILQMFLDKKASGYSVHQIASMGASEGKEVGEWFGPNTIAQVMKKLAVYDEWSDIVVHVALDNTIIIDDIEALCRVKPASNEDVPCTCQKVQSCSNTDCVSNSTDSDDTTCKKCTAQRASDSSSTSSEKRGWRPLLLVVPLRLGLTDINSVYTAPLKACLTFQESVGIIGGKPNHAHWFLGAVEEELIYLDPHLTQEAVDTSLPEERDDTYHCPFICRMNIHQLDPSVALGFYCGSEKEFQSLCCNIRQVIVCGQKTPMFELYHHRPPHWPAFEPYQPYNPNSGDYSLVDGRQFDSDDEFELL